jgi:hypothetical protein
MFKDRNLKCTGGPGQPNSERPTAWNFGKLAPDMWEHPALGLVESAAGRCCRASTPSTSCCKFCPPAAPGVTSTSASSLAFFFYDTTTLRPVTNFRSFGFLLSPRLSGLFHRL